MRPRRPAIQIRPSNVPAGCRAPSGGHVYFVPSLPELGRRLQGKGFGRDARGRVPGGRRGWRDHSGLAGRARLVLSPEVVPADLQGRGWVPSGCRREQEGGLPGPEVGTGPGGEARGRREPFGRGLAWPGLQRFPRGVFPGPDSEAGRPRRPRTACGRTR